MGCDIHIATEIRKDEKWTYVPEIPETLKDRNYNVFAALAGVRDSWNTCIFQPKGVPEDVSSRKLRFKSNRDSLVNIWETMGDTRVELPDGTLMKISDIAPLDITEGTYEAFRRLSDMNDTEYQNRYAYLRRYSDGKTVRCSVVDINTVNGKFVQVPYKVLFPELQDFLDDHYSEEYDKDAGDYGYWDLDFDSPDIHTPSWLTLRELAEADYSEYTAKKYKISKDLYDRFIAAGGKFPEGFTVQESAVSDIRDAICESVSPTVTIVIQGGKSKDAYPPVNGTNNQQTIEDMYPLFKGIDELQTIAKKYDVCPDDIRIVFGFDN